MTRLLNTIILSLASVFIGLPNTSHAAETIDREYQLKAAYLYNILKFISWPEMDTSKPERLTVCIISPNFSHDSLLDLNNKRIDNIVIKIRQNININDIGECRVLYFSGGKINTRLDHLVEKGLFLIGEHDNFNAQGGTLNFFVENNKLQFEINLTAASQAGIKISSKLLSLAHIYDN